MISLRAGGPRVVGFRVLRYIRFTELDDTQTVTLYAAGAAPLSYDFSFTPPWRSTCRNYRNSFPSS
jgi:hypothetical protein